MDTIVSHIPRGKTFREIPLSILYLHKNGQIGARRTEASPKTVLPEGHVPGIWNQKPLFLRQHRKPFCAFLFERKRTRKIDIFNLYRLRYILVRKGNPFKIELSRAVFDPYIGLKAERNGKIFVAASDSYAYTGFYDAVLHFSGTAKGILYPVLFRRKTFSASFFHFFLHRKIGRKTILALPRRLPR